VNSTAQAAAATLFAQTMAPTLTATLTPTNTPKPTPTALPFKALDGLRVVYTTSKGNLYVQDSGKSAIQLTHGVKESTERRPPLISDDGHKIIFYRTGESKLDSVYVINVDGTSEQVLVNPELLSAFGKEYDKYASLFSIAFVPGTHLLLFNTYQQGNFDPESAGWLPIVGNDLFVVNTDNGEIKQLKAPWQGGNFLVAPNGKWVAVQTLDHIDIIDVQGQIVQHNLVTYSKTEGHVMVPMYWTTDSRELIVLPSEIPLFAGVPAVRTVWRYPLDGSSGIEIKINPSPVYDAYAVSPDGNWIAYSYDSGGVDPNTMSGIYLGNLRNGTSQLVYSPQPNQNTGFVDVPNYYDGWSPDSLSFIVHDDIFRLFIGDIHAEIVPIGSGRGIEVSGWIDNNHLLMENGVLYEVSKQELVQVVNYLESFVFLGH
jgi:hypothetical protein